MSATKDAAHEFRAAGWRPVLLQSVGPDGTTCSCGRGANCGKNAGKHPVEDGWQDLDLSGADIEELWSGLRERANVGIATGAVSGFWVLDIDGEAGLASARAWGEEHGSFFSTATTVVSTPGGGYHLYYSLPADFDVRNSQGKLAPGIDVRGSGGYVVAPPSVSWKGPYSWTKRGDLEPAPAWLVERLREATVTKRVEVTEADRAAYDALDEAERERIDRYVDRIVASEVAALDALPRPWVEGAGWDAGVHRSACALLQLAQSPWNAYTAEQAYAAVVSHAPTDSQWTAEHVNAKWLAAVKSVAGKIKPFPEKPIDISDFETDSDVADAPAASPETKSEFPPVSWFFDKDTGLDVDRVSRWVLKTNDLARGVDGKIWGYNDGVWHRDEDAIARTVAKILTGRYRNSHVANVQRYVELQLETIYCRPVPGYMNFLNGMLDWRTGVLLPHQRELHSTIQFPYNWNEDAQCPQFDKFLAQVLSEDYIKLAWEMLGYLLYSGNNLQTAFLFLGTGQNGKGTLMRVIEGLLGEGNYSSQSLDSLNTNKFSPANLFGKIANIAGDIDATYQESTASFKKLTGEDTYSGEFKYGAAFNFESWAVPLFSANKIPGSADVSEGYLRRWVVLEFNRHISNAERKAGLSNLLLAELPGIAAKAVRALRPLQERGHFAPEGEAIRGKERFADAIDQVRQWVEECTIAAPDHRETRNNLYISYTNWSHRTGGGKLKASEFYERLVNLGYEHKVVRGQRFITGLVMAPATMDGSGQESDTQAQEADF